MAIVIIFFLGTVMQRLKQNSYSNFYIFYKLDIILDVYYQKLERRGNILSKSKLFIIIKQVFWKNLFHIFVELLITIIKQLILI